MGSEMPQDETARKIIAILCNGLRVRINHEGDRVLMINDDMAQADGFRRLVKVRAEGMLVYYTLGTSERTKIGEPWTDYFDVFDLQVTKTDVYEKKLLIDLYLEEPREHRAMFTQEAESEDGLNNRESAEEQSDG